MSFPVKNTIANVQEASPLKSEYELVEDRNLQKSGTLQGKAVTPQKSDAAILIETKSIQSQAVEESIDSCLYMEQTKTIVCKDSLSEPQTKIAEIFQRKFKRHIEETRYKLPIFTTNTQSLGKKQNNKQLNKKRSIQNIPKLTLYEDPEFPCDSGRSILESDGVTYKLKKYKKGDFHQVWEVIDQPGSIRPDILIKTPNFARNSYDLIECSTNLKKAYDDLLQREAVRKDIRVSLITFKTGFMECERLNRTIDVTNWQKGSLEKVLRVFESMLESKELFISDFRPCNVMLDSHENIVIIDPDLNTYDSEESACVWEIASDIVRYLKQWSGDDQNILQYFIDNMAKKSGASEYAANLWEAIMAILKSQNDTLKH